jgi:hypothetical protein
MTVDDGGGDKPPPFAQKIPLARRVFIINLRGPREPRLACSRRLGPKVLWNSKPLEAARLAPHMAPHGLPKHCRLDLATTVLRPPLSVHRRRFDSHDFSILFAEARSVYSGASRSSGWARRRRAAGGSCLG